MKKFLVLLAVAAMIGIGSMAFASDISVSGSIDVRSRDFGGMSLFKDISSTADVADTQERVRLNIDAKAGDVKGRISIENDYDTWGRFESKQANAATTSPDSGPVFLQLREAWMNFNLPGVPVNVTAGHQLLQLGQGWFFRSMKYGSDAWVLANVSGANTAAFVDVKISEGASNVSDDIDAYVLLDVFKISDTMMAGIDITMANDRYNGFGFSGTNQTTTAQNIGLNFTGKLGPLGLKAELDLQMGTAKQAGLDGTTGTTASDAKLSGNQVVIQGNVPMDPVAINFTVAMGSGQKSSGKDYTQYVNFLDSDQHYTLLYEYKIGNPNCAKPYNTKGTHQGFCDTTAVNVGASMDATKSLNVGLDLWYLLSSEKIPDVTSTTAGATTSALGTEIDVKVNWKLADALSWNWTLGYLSPGAGLGKDPAMGAQGVLSYKF